MSFAFMPIYTGDYLRDTRHLTPSKHGVYLLLLMHCWDQKGPLPLDEQECSGIANCRSADEIESLRYILNKYFIRMDDGWYNRRMQGEVEKSEAISAARSDAGKKGYQAKAKHLLSKSQASASTPTPTPTPITTPSLTPTPRKTKPLAPSALPDWMPVDAWNDYLDHRKAKRAKSTKRGIELMIEELEGWRQKGHSIETILNTSIKKGWTGLFEPKRSDSKPASLEESGWVPPEEREYEPIDSTAERVDD